MPRLSIDQNESMFLCSQERYAAARTAIGERDELAECLSAVMRLVTEIDMTQFGNKQEVWEQFEKTRALLARLEVRS